MIGTSQVRCWNRPVANWQRFNGRCRFKIGSVVALPFVVVCIAALSHSPAAGAPPGKKVDGGRLTYLDELNPYYASQSFPKLTTPQWVGEKDVEAVVTLAIDDMREPSKYEAYLRPILQRLKQIDGRAPVSIMTCQVKPDDPQLQSWLAEGLSIEIHTVDHPCPLLKDGHFAKAKKTYDDCIDLMHQIPGNEPVAYRMPCCDSLNTVSPRAFAEIFNKTTSQKHFLQIDTSVFNVITWKDPELPREIAIDEEGRERFRKYLPTDRTFVNTIENYPYPYVIGGLCWEFPCVTPSDWSAQHFHGPNNPTTLRDWKAYLDAVVLKQGTFNIVFHPHGWITSDQVVEFIDYAQMKYGKRVKFLNFRESLERMNRFMLAEQPLRRADGDDNGVRVLDVNNDGFLDVVIANEELKQTRIWKPDIRRWESIPNPDWITVPNSPNETARLNSLMAWLGPFGVLTRDGNAAALLLTPWGRAAWRFSDSQWVRDESLLAGLDSIQPALLTSDRGIDVGVRLRDLDGDGICELISGGVRGIHHQYTAPQVILRFDEQDRRWKKLPFELPDELSIVQIGGGDAGLRFIDIDEDGRDDILFSNDEKYALHLFTSMEKGWSLPVVSAERPGENEVPPIVRKGMNNGAWFHSRHMFVQNEDTAGMKDLVARVSYDKLLEGVEPRAIGPQQSRSLFETRTNFTVELMAAEPQVLDPVAFEWGADGRLWVVEMADYPLGMDNNGKPGGRLRVLEDTDGDGSYDKSTLFLGGLNFPNGIMPWRKGVLVSSAPEIFYAEDTNSDGKADKRETLFQGFIEGNQQHRVNGFTYGLDNWVYCANGDSDGEIVSTKTGMKTSIRGYDFRFQPDTGEIELEAGKTQFGRNRDDWGNWFGSSNSDPMYHFVLPETYLRRNPALTVERNKHAISENPGPAPVFPISRSMARFNDFDRLNRFTSACSAVVYRDDLFGPEFVGNAFISEPVHNLVHREIISPSGLTFTSKRAADEQKSEFLASRDNWFRPTMIKVGPDGALWIADMYRHLIEHPQYIPKERWDKLPMRAGDNRGRIYRVFPTGKKPRAIPRLDKLTTAELVAVFESPNGWQRDTAQRLLVEKHDDAALPLLTKLVLESPQPLARLHALCTLDGLDTIANEVLLAVLADKHPSVRRHAARIAESRLAGDAKLSQAVLALSRDDDVQVRLQVALSLGSLNHADAHAALARLLLRDGHDPWFATGILSSLRAENIVTVLKSYLDDREHSRSQPELTGRLFAHATASVGKNEVALSQVLELLFAVGEEGKHPAWQFAALAEALDARERQRGQFWQRERGESVDFSNHREQIVPLIFAARMTAANQDTNESDRIAAIRLLGRDEDGKVKLDLDVLNELTAPGYSSAIQRASIDRLGRIRDERALEILINGWKSFSPELRGHVLDSLLNRFRGSRLVLSAIESGKMTAGEISAERRERLLRSRFPGMRKRAEKVFAGAISVDRTKVLEQYRAALDLKGDHFRGQKLFARTCAACHRVNDVGYAVGPDLAALKDRAPESLLVAVFDPSRAVESKFVNYIAVTKAGQTFAGILANESGGSITLLGPEGKTQTILREDIDELTSAGKSAMPEGLEKDLTPQDAADLLLYVQSIGRIP